VAQSCIAQKINENGIIRIISDNFLKVNFSKSKGVALSGLNVEPLLFLHDVVRLKAYLKTLLVILVIKVTLLRVDQ